MATKKGPTLTFRKKNGGTFQNSFHSISTAKKAVRAWRNKGGSLVGASAKRALKLSK